MKQTLCKKTTVLTIAGSDSGGGAGVQGDIKTISACGCYASSAITAITVQNTLGVRSVFPIPTDVVRQQIDAVLSDIGADAIKIGMITSAEIMNCIAEEINIYGIKNVVCDTVMVSTSGHRLMEEEAIDTFITSLTPCARVITPNIPEAKILLQRYNNCAVNDICNKNDMILAAKQLANYSGVSVLLKGGHLEDDNLVDIFYNNEEKEIIELPSVRIDTCNTHGTGCTLSSAFASMLARGETLSHSALEAKEYINNAIASGVKYKIGNGIGPLDHFWK